MIDLHTHSNLSDGTLSPNDLILYAKRRGIDTLAISDHETISNFKKYSKFAEKNGVKMIPAVEINAGDFKNFHLVAYGVQDLAEEIDRRIEKEKDEYNLSCYKVLANYVSKFRRGGRNSALWNGFTTFNPTENFVCFNFQKLLSNKNNLIGNAQMLLVLKWLDNEVIKNRDYNQIFGSNRKIVIAIDEAHVFIDEKFPIALDFMYQLAKRIRKYNGMQIVITQNVKDFVGSPDIARKSSAIINVSQYSFIFSLSPNDMSDLCSLYEKAGQINENETETIVNLPRGSAFLITGPANRTNIRIVSTPHVREIFEEKKCSN